NEEPGVGDVVKRAAVEPREVVVEAEVVKEVDGVIFFYADRTAVTGGPVIGKVAFGNDALLDTVIVEVEATGVRGNGTADARAIGSAPDVIAGEDGGVDRHAVESANGTASG